MSAHIKPTGVVQVYIKPETPHPKQWGVVLGLLGHAAAELYAEPVRAKEEIIEGFAQALAAGPRSPTLVQPGNPPLLITVQ